MKITSIESINLKSFSISIQLELELRWKDSRLMFRNLKMTSNLTILNEADRIWKPSLFIEDATGSPVKMKILRISNYAYRQSDPLENDGESLYRSTYLKLCMHIKEYCQACLRNVK